MESLYEASFDFEDDFSQESDADIGHVASDDEAFVLDLHSLEALQEKITGSIEKSEDELCESDDEFPEENYETEMLQEEFEKL
ncbi:16177_t:CDS:1, partial [Cetraspora pellucida]